jgi:hypothetical protein
VHGSDSVPERLLRRRGMLRGGLRCWLLVQCVGDDERTLPKTGGRSVLSWDGVRFGQLCGRLLLQRELHGFVRGVQRVWQGGHVHGDRGPTEARTCGVQCFADRSGLWTVMQWDGQP